MLITSTSYAKKIHLHPGVRFAGVINQMGNLVAGGFKDGINRLVDYNKEHMMYMELVLELRMRKEFDEELGQVNYLHSRRDKVSMISIPLNEYLVLISAEVWANVEELVKTVQKLLKK